MKKCAISIYYNTLLSCLLLAISFPQLLLAYAPYSPNYNPQDDAESLGALSNQIVSGPLSILTNGLYIVCYVISAMLFFSAITQYRAHRANKKQVPLSRPIMLLLFAAVVFSLQYITKLSHSASVFNNTI